MSRHPSGRNVDAPTNPPQDRDQPVPACRLPARERQERLGHGHVEGGLLALPRLRRRETLCETVPFRVQRAGRGTARWGRYLLASDSVEALRTVGSFGAVEVTDLAALFETATRARRALRRLQRKALLRVETFRRGQRVLDVASLTNAGKRLMERVVDPREPGDERAQRYRAGPARSAQVLHDTAVYRAARREMEAIETQGGRILAVRTDSDLCRLALRRAGRAKRPGASSKDVKAEVVASLGLIVRDDRLVYPDIRIEYERPTASGAAADVGFVDVEVSTPDYRGPALQAKAAAGFRLYRMAADGGLCAGSPAPGLEVSR